MPSAPKAPTSEGRLRRPGERSVQARSAKPSTATENGACRREAPNLPRPRNALMGDDDEAIVQSGESRRPSRPIGPICPTASCYGTSQTCLRVQGVFPHSLLQGAKRRAAVAVSGEAAERPMEPEAVRAHCCVFAVPILAILLCVPLFSSVIPCVYKTSRAYRLQSQRQSL